MLKRVLLLALPWLAFAYENIALHKNAWQLHPYDSPHFIIRDSVNASKAVDGRKTNLSFSGYQCTESANNKYEALWWVDLGTVLGIHHITIYYRTDNVYWGPNHGYIGRFLGFAVYISNTTDKEDGVLCFKDDKFTRYTIPAVITLNCTHHGRYVIYYNNRTPNSKPKPPDYSEYAYNELCEFEVYGCPSDHFGVDCSEPCPARCKNSRCHIDTGYCFECEDGYQGLTCEQLCQNKTYGADCSEECGHCLGGQQCNHVIGTCHIGYDAGYYNYLCKGECPDGLYGRNCFQTCNKNCFFKTCDKKYGACQAGCVAGWKPPLCNEECGNGTFGTNCSGTCGQCYKGQSCDKKTGACCTGCDSGYEGTYCNKSCAQRYHGPNCNLTCSTFCFNQTCDSRSGVCLTASEENKNTEETSIVRAVGGFIGVVFIIVTVVIIIICRRNNFNACQCKIPKNLAFKSFNRSSDSTSHMPKTYADLIESQVNEVDENAYNTIEKELPSKDIDTYEQLLTDISLNELGYVIIEKGKENDHWFKKELTSLPRGEQFQCDTGKLSVNSEKNRAYSTLPYDHSRVILRRNVGTSDDYINANYITGAERKNEYIATQGPLNTTLMEFWEMVCQDQIQQIIMLTNLTEQGQVKCYQYWPKDGTTEFYGTVCVKSIEEKSYAFFTKRKLEVSQRGIKTFMVIQFHYTTWPEHGTPDPLCFVIFHHHVIHENTYNGISPILVHCSTGTGRSGIFIALDYLYKTGKLSGRVNVAKYVMSMRKNRMNMVEHYEQYKAIFLALREAFKAEPVFLTSREFLDMVSPMLKKASAISSYIKREFEWTNMKTTNHQSLLEEGVLSKL